MRYIAVEVFDRSERIGAVGADGDRTNARDDRGLTSGVGGTTDVEARDSQGVINIDVVGQDVAGGNGVFQGTAGVGFQLARVINRINLHIQRAAGTGVRGVADLRYIAVEVFDRREGVRAVGADGDAANARDDRGLAGGVGGAVDVEGRNAQCAVHIEVVGQHIACGDGVFQGTAGIGFQDARVVNRHDVHIQRAAGTGVGGVADLRYIAVEVFDRGEGVRTVGADGDRTNARDDRGLTGCVVSTTHIEACDSQGVVDINVVGQHIARGNVVFQGAAGVSFQDARVVNRHDVHVQRAAGTGVGGVADLRYIAVEVFDWGEDVGAIGADGDAANARDDCGLAGCVGGATNVEACDRQGVVDIDVIGQHIASGNGVFQGTAGVGFQDARVVNRHDVHIQRAAGTGVGGVADLRYIAVEVVNRSEGVCAVGADGDRTNARDDRGLAGGVGGTTDVEARDSQGVVDIDIVGQHIARGNVVFQRTAGIGFQDARVINRVNLHIQRAARSGVGGVPNLRHITIKVFNRSKGVRAIDTDGDRTHASNNRSLARSVGSTAHVEAGNAQHAVDVTVVGQHIAGGNLVFQRTARIRAQYARIVDRNHFDRQRN
ncbi:hypothetical protein [Pseudomonas sp. 31 E 5]|nr:hypothetical protein [Pseudomonas sp. 31 E 5]